MIKNTPWSLSRGLRLIAKFVILLCLFSVDTTMTSAQEISDDAVAELYVEALRDFHKVPLKLHVKDQQVLVTKPCNAERKLPYRVGTSDIMWFCKWMELSGQLDGAKESHKGRSVIMIEHKQPHADTVIVRIDQKSLDFVGPTQRYRDIDVAKHPAYKLKNHDYIFVKSDVWWKIVRRGKEIDLDRAKRAEIEAIFQKGNSLHKQGKFKEALEYVEKSMRMDSSLYQRHLFLAEIKTELGMYESAIADVTKSIERCDHTPNNSHVSSYLQIRADIHLLNKDLDAAVKDLKSALELVPKDGQALKKLAKIYLEDQKFDQAVLYLDQLVALDNQDWESQYLRGLAYIKLNQPKKACTDLKLAKKEGYRVSKRWLSANCSN